MHFIAHAQPFPYGTQIRRSGRVKLRDCGPILASVAGDHVDPFPNCPVVEVRPVDDVRVRIGTWNLEGRWSPGHAAFLVDLDCDVLLLTEVQPGTAVEGYVTRFSRGVVVGGQHWAALSTRSASVGCEDPHPASVSATLGKMTVCSSVLPWRACGPDPWGPGTTAERTERALATLLPHFEEAGCLVWGGDWNHALSGPELAASKAGRTLLEAAVERLGLQVPTRDLPHRLDGLASIDHIAIPRSANVVEATRVSATGPARPLSDHDAYVVEMT